MPIQACKTGLVLILPGEIPVLHDDEKIDNEDERCENGSSQLVGRHRPVIDPVPRNPVRRDDRHH